MRSLSGSCDGEKKPPVISVVGNSGVGKTTFLEKLVAELKARGYRVACIKHDCHNFDMDRPGKDTWRLTQAGSDIVMISAPDKLALIERAARERSLADLVAFVDDRVDVVLTEGYRSAAALKIEVSRREMGPKLTSRLDDLLAVVSDQPFELAVPQFGLDGTAEVADLLEQRFRLTASRRRRAVAGKDR
ncbi:MAG: molybdopterin-guanine dinucleotide biosynthesis protein B [Chloroflexi bacterium]|nr:molybdopterin-guanine dinucleotide biosynthesis protein B [Chloroflexota bacterium]